MIEISEADKLQACYSIFTVKQACYVSVQTMKTTIVGTVAYCSMIMML
jgi:hypothetical protein